MYYQQRIRKGKNKETMKERDLTAYQNYKTEPQEVPVDKPTANSILCVVSCYGPYATLNQTSMEHRYLEVCFEGTGKLGNP